MSRFNPFRSLGIVALTIALGGCNVAGSVNHSADFEEAVGKGLKSASDLSLQELGEVICSAYGTGSFIPGLDSFATTDIDFSTVEVLDSREDWERAVVEEYGGNVNEISDEEWEFIEAMASVDFDSTKAKSVKFSGMVDVTCPQLLSSSPPPAYTDVPILGEIGIIERNEGWEILYIEAKPET